MPPEAGAGAVAPGAALRTALRALADGRTLDADQAADAFGAVVAGDATPGQIGALLMGLRVRGETVEELTGIVRALRRAMVPLAAEHPEDLVDTCGTGGGAVTTFNVSTVAAFVAVGAGVRVAKHGNRSYTSRCGSADVLEALGVSLTPPASALAQVLAEAGLVFMFAPQMHPAMRHVAPVRRELGVTTVMNLVGPLTNPASAGRQVVGVGDRARLALVADALAALGTTHALVVHGEPGLDEISPLGPTQVMEVRAGDGRRQEWAIDPNRYGLGGAIVADLACGEPAVNAAIAIDLLSGRGPAGARAAVILNAAAAVYVSGRTATYDEAIDRARYSLETGCGLAALDRMKSAYARAAESQA
jgi:anthranilate phosphoribosyltransferase